MDKSSSTDTSEYNFTDIRSIFCGNSKFDEITLTDGTTKLLDLLIAMTNLDQFNIFLEKLNNVNVTLPLDSLIWPGCSILHLAVMMSKESKLLEELVFKRLESQFRLDTLTSSIKKDNMKYEKRIEMCLENNCDVNIKNSDGLTAIHIAFKLQKENIVHLLIHRGHNNLLNANDLSFFHMYCAMGQIFKVEDYLKEGVDVNSRTSVSFEWFIECSYHSHPGRKIITIPANSTALHIAAAFQNKELVELLLDMGADVDIQNILGLTPIHMSMIPCSKQIYEKPRYIAQLLFKKASNLTESMSSCGLSHLHIAAYADDSNIVIKLLLMGSNIDSVFKINVPELEYLADYANRTPLQIALFKFSCKATTTLISYGADVSQQTPEISTSLQTILHYFDDFSNLTIDSYIKDVLKCDKRFKEAVDVNGTTLLHVACHLIDLGWAKKLLKKGADVNARILNDQLVVYSWKDFTPMHMLVNAISESRHDDAEEEVNLVKLLINSGADLLAISYEGHSPLLLAYSLARLCLEEDDDYEIYERKADFMFPIADLLLKSQVSYNVNPADKCGFSHFHYACMRNHVDIVTKFLDNGIDVNHTASVRFGGKIYGFNFTPLHFAMYSHSKEVACLLIERGANVNAMNTDKETPFHIAIAVRFLDFHLFEMLLRYGTDINAYATYKSTPIHCFCQYSNEITHEQLKFFLNRGSKIDIIDEEEWEYEEGLIGLAMKKAKPCDRELILEEFIDICNVKESLRKNYSAIENIVAVRKNDKLTLNFYLVVIQRFIDMGYKLDERILHGKTALNRAISLCNVEAVEALLLLGANVNITDANYEISTDPRYMSDENIPLVKIFADHLWKMKFVGLKVNEECETTMLQIHKEFPLDKDFESRCEKELAALAKEKIGESLTIRCLLQDWSPVMDYPTMSFVQRHDIDRFFAKFSDLHSKFPQLCGLLMMQYRMVTARMEMYEIAMRLLPSVIHVDLPDLCLDNILKFFENDELEYFIEEHNQNTV